MKTWRCPFKWGDMVLAKSVMWRHSVHQDNDDGSWDWTNRWVPVAPADGKSRLGIFLGCVTLRDVVLPGYVVLTGSPYDLNDLVTAKTHRAARVCFKGRKPVYVLVSDLVKA